MTGSGFSRRDVLKLGVGTTAAAVAGCSAAPLNSSELEPQLKEVRSATEEYQDPKAALEDGFVVSGPFVPGMGWHFLHPGRVQQAAEEGVDLTTPQVLNYDADLTLVAAEWGVPKNAVEEEPDLFDDENADAEETWHEHGAATHVYAKPDGERNSPEGLSLADLTTAEHWSEFQPPDEDLEAGDEVELNWGSPKGKEGETEARVADIVSTHPGLLTLHVWAHEDNEKGVFNPTNPELGGDGHDHEH